MTCIVGIADGARVFMGADSASVDTESYAATVSRVQKLFRNGECLIGGTVSWRLLQLARFAFEAPEVRTDADLEKYMVVHFVDRLRACFKDGGAVKVDQGMEEGGEFLVGLRGRMFHISTDWQVNENSWGFDACGCGANFALGALHAMAETLPEAKIEHALRVAETCSAAVARPFVIRSNGGRK